jgi:hypothetical protein
MSSPSAVHPHPLMDARTPGVVITRSVSSRVVLGSGIGDFVLSAARARRRAVLVTGADAVLSDHLATLLRETGSGWGVGDANGQAWDGMTGRILNRPESADGRPAIGLDDVHRGYLEPPGQPAFMRVRLSVARRHRNAFETIIGGDAELLARRLAGSAPAGWGLHEPAGMVWDKVALTAFAREAGESVRVIVAGSRAARESTGEVAVHRTDRGLEEVSDVLIELGPEGHADTRNRISQVAPALAALAEGVPLFAVAFADPGRADLYRAARLPRPPWPLALLIGAPAVRALDIDASALASRHGGRVLGGRRTPSLLLDVADDEPARSWARVRGIADELGRERVAIASPAMADMLFGVPL